MEQQYEKALDAVQSANIRNKELDEMIRKLKEELVAMKRKYEDTKHRYEEELRAKELMSS
jgi:predicted  nucleic acid-binding Zn-ribbon protein